ncbi:MAG: amidohydrolase family protein [Planctomycetes bacterium]|nr:amidohydrolase family protein [Planctomycetota bacterium]
MSHLISRTFVSTALSLGLLALAPDAHAGNGKIAIKAGRVITMVGPDIVNGVITIEDGRITGVSADAKAAWDAEVLDHPELVAFPGWVEAHSNRGMDRPNENVPVAPFLDVRDSIDPISFYFEDSLRAGVLTINVQQGNACVIGGQGMVVKPFGLTIEQMLVKQGSGLKLVAGARPGRSRATQAQELRKAFLDLRQYLDKLVQDKQDGKDYARREALFQGKDLEKEENKKGRAFEGTANWKVPGLEAIPRGEIDDQKEPLLRLVEGKLPAFMYCDSGSSVQLALDVARANGFLANTVLVLEGDSWKAADAILEAGVPVVLSPNLMYVERDPLTGKETETFVPKVFSEKKIRFALQSLNPSAQSLWFQAAQCVANGLDRTAALEAATRTPADILRLGKRVGSLEQGKDGNVVLLSGDPLSVRSTVQYVVIGGNLVYDRSKDVRMKHLMNGVEPNNTAPGGVMLDASGHPCNDAPTVDEKSKTDKGEKPPEEKPHDDHKDEPKKD